ncbi:phosducin [Orbilia brochopaga]|nr:phosducin [Drechslerella brochopaga]
MDMPVNVPVDNPNADTEWNDILRKHGIIPERPPSPTKEIEKALTEAARLAHENRLEGKTLEELSDLEDEEDEEFLASYRQRRLAELSTLAHNSPHGSVYPLQKPDYARDVTEASNACFVLVHLASASRANVESMLLTNIWREVARKYPDIKFCEMRGDLAIEGYPERNCPTVLVYKDTEIKRQIVTLKTMGGEKCSITDIEQLLVEIGAVKMNDFRLIRKQDKEERQSSIKTSTKKAADDDDDDWD